MSRWLRSGLRRDACVVLAGEGELTAQALKSRLEDNYGDRIAPKRFYGALSALEDAGHVVQRVDGIDDVYALTDAGEERLVEHVEWVRDEVGDVEE